jgi:hypothetical protein
MNQIQMIEKIQALPLDKQIEVKDFVDFLSARTAHAEWTNATFADMSMVQALRGMEDEPQLYTIDDLKEDW